MLRFSSIANSGWRHRPSAARTEQRRCVRPKHTSDCCQMYLITDDCLLMTGHQKSSLMIIELSHCSFHVPHFIPISDLTFFILPSFPLSPPLPLLFPFRQHGTAATGCKSRRHGNTSWSVVLVRRRRRGMHPMLVAGGGVIRQANIIFCSAHTLHVSNE